jgi:hypothetical protein
MIYEPKIKIVVLQFQIIIIFDEKLLLSHVTWAQKKTHDKIYKLHS